MRKNSILSVLFLTIAIFGSVSLTRGATIEELQQQINTHNQTIQQLEKEITQYQTDLDKTSTQAKTLQGTIKTLDLNAKKLQASLDLTKSKINATNLTIEKLSGEIGNKNDQINQNHEALAESIRQISGREDTSLFEIFLEYKNMSQFWNEFDTTEQFQSKVKEQTDFLKALQTELIRNKTLTQQKKDELVNLQNDLKDQKEVIDANKTQKNKLLAQTKNTESGYKKLIASNQAKKKAFENELFQIESELKLKIDPKSLPTAKPGVLAWPLSRHRITQYFGNTAFAATHVAIYNGSGHNGVDLAASIGTPVMSAGNGTVVGTGDTDTVCPGASFGKWVMVEHTNGLSTLYAHLSVIRSAAGQKVSEGEVLGYSGATGYSTGPHLHFTVYASQGVKIMTKKSKSCGGSYTMPFADLQAYLNPLSYL